MGTEGKKVAEASHLSFSEDQRRDASATFSPALKGRKTTVQGNTLGNRPTTNPSPEGAVEGGPFVRLAEVGVISGGLTKNSKRDSNELQVSYLRVGNVYQNELRLDEIKTIGLTEREFAKTRLEKGDLLIVEGNGSKDQIGRLAIWDGSVEPCVHQNHLIRVRLSEQVLPKFAVYWFSSQEGRSRIEHVASSTSGLYTLSVSKIGSLELPLPPLPEQRRIVARIEELFSRLDAGVAALRHAKAQLQRYRQSVLAAAVTGQLTQAWREKHPQGEPAMEMLGVLLDRLANGITAEQSKDPPGIPVSRIETISDATINYKRVRYVREIDREKCAQFMVRDGDILFSHINSDLHLGKSAVAIGDRELLHGMNLLLMRSCERINSKYLNYVLTHLRFSGYFIGIAQHAVNQSSLNQKKLKAIPIPVPLLAEQHQIVAEVEARTTAIDHLEAELDRQINRSNRLRKSVLQTAYSGQL